MPLDLQSELLRRQQLTDSYLAGLPQTQANALDASGQELNNLRSNFFGGIQPGIGEIGKNVGVTFNGNPTRSAMGQLSQEAQRGLAQRKYEGNATRLSDLLNLGNARQTTAFNNTQGANAFARQSAMANSQNDFNALQSELDRQHGLQQQDKLDQFAQEMANLKQSYLPKVDYQGALTRSLFGLGTSLGTGYVLNKYGRPGQQTDSPYPTSNSQQYGPQQLASGYYPQPSAGFYPQQY